MAIEGAEGPAAVLRTRRQATQLDRLPGMEEREAAHADIADLIDRQPDDVAQPVSERGERAMGEGRAAAAVEAERR